MIGSVITSLFLLNAMCPYVDLTKLVWVNACPKNQSEVTEASKSLGCGNDTFGNNQYLCLPNKNKTSLIEFCFDGVMGIHEKGICLEVSDGKLIYHSCYNFLIGCPDTHFYDYEFYKYPACQEINTTLNCYISDPTCSHQLVEERSDYDDIILYTSSILGGLIGFVSVCIILRYLYQRKTQTEIKGTNNPMSTINNTQLPELNPFLKDENRGEHPVAQDMIKVETKSEESFDSVGENNVDNLFAQEGRKVERRGDESFDSEGENNVDNLFAQEGRKVERRSDESMSHHSRHLHKFRLVLIGKTGSGKSTTGNTILGREDFVTKTAGKSVTNKCLQASSCRRGQEFIIVDTPGLFDTRQTDEETNKELCKCIAFSSPGPHVFIIVLSCSRFTDEEGESVSKLVSFFGENIYKYSIVLFTGKDNLEYDGGGSLYKFISESPPGLIRLVDKCGRRVIAFNNRLPREKQDEQVEELFEMISKLVSENKEMCYTNEMYKEAELFLERQEREKREREENKRRYELAALENQFLEKYRETFEFYENKNRDVRGKLKRAMRLLDENKRCVISLQNQISCKNNQSRQINASTVASLEDQLKEKQKAVYRANKEINRLKENERIMNEWKMHEQRILNMYEKRIEEIRDENRTHIERDRNYLQHFFNWFKQKLSKK